MRIPTARPGYSQPRVLGQDRSGGRRDELHVRACIVTPTPCYPLSPTAIANTRTTFITRNGSSLPAHNVSRAQVFGQFKAPGRHRHPPSCLETADGLTLSGACSLPVPLSIPEPSATLY